MAFLLLFLVLPIFHLAEATTCKDDNCNGLLIIGGAQSNETDPVIETFPADATCSIPPIPQERKTHTLSVINDGQVFVLCGGSYTKQSCISWSSGQSGWTYYATLIQKREVHAAVVVKTNTIIIVGGYDEKESEKTGEIVKSGIQFDLKHYGRGTCALAYEGGFVTIGGYESGVFIKEFHGKVDRYDSEGNHVGSLADLNVPRREHACMSFISEGEQALLVAGGKSDDIERVASTEVYLPRKHRWTRVANLPRGLKGLRGAHFNHQLVVAGGSDGTKRDEVLQYDIESDTWSEIGKMASARRHFGMVEVNLRAICPEINLNPTDCKVGDWTAWGKCSRSCDGGIKTRLREVLQEAKHGGVKCPDLEISVVCNTDKCKEPVVFGPWRDTDICTETCGEGKLLEQRSCTPAHSCASLKTTQTLRPGNTPCVGQHCQGEIQKRIEAQETKPSPGLGETAIIAITITGSLLLLTLLICLLGLVCCRRWILSNSFKDDLNPNYGTYQEEGEDVVMEAVTLPPGKCAVDSNMEYEQQAAASKAPAREERNERQVSGRNWEETYDRMYEA